MKIFVENCINVLRYCLNLLRWVGFLVPDELTGLGKILAPFYFFFWFMFSSGFSIISQSVSLVQEWGNVNEMTAISFILFTNLAYAMKIFNVMLKRKAIQAIIDAGDIVLKSEVRAEGKKIVSSLNKETTSLYRLYAVDIAITFLGWVVSSALTKQLLFPAWYPYDTSKFPYYHLTFLYQAFAVFAIATTHVSLDQLLTTLTAVCRCRLQLVNLSLRTLFQGIMLSNKLITAKEEEMVKARLRRCVLQHQATLQSTAEIQKCFTATILVQFFVTVIIICATAYQLAEEVSGNILDTLPLTAYFFGMVLQVYLYCNAAHKLTEESSLIADAVYECPWYLCSVSLRRALLNVMVRSRQVAVLTAGGFATLSLECFMSIIRISYSFFTVLMQVEE